MTDKGQCPVCRTYEFPAELADVAIPRHAPTHSGDEWDRVVQEVRISMTAAEERHAQVMTNLQRRLAAAEQWAGVGAR